MLQFRAMAKLGVYIQVPFCQTKCTYCNFHTGVVPARRFAPYVEAVCREIRSHSLLRGAPGVSLPAGLTVDSVYIGGGTPSLLEPRLLGEILQAIRNSFSCALDEVTLEADPETIEAEKAADWAASGINRISFGVQSFIDDELKSAGRRHRAAHVYQGVGMLRNLGFANISFDLIAGLPKQTEASWGRSLEELIALSPEHVSTYIMEIDEGSRLGLEVLEGGSRYSARELPNEELMADFYALAQRELRSAGYQQYEISNWAKPGFPSRHNLKYWRREPYLGFGAGAHSFSGTERWANVHDAAAYVASVSAGQSAVESIDTVTRELAFEEELFLGLRQLAGIDLRRIERQYGVDLEAKLLHLASRGMVEREGNMLRLPADKLSVSNEIIVELLR
jgi:oxygen-independent coproporphyrinogen-3 oxidase